MFPCHHLLTRRHMLSTILFPRGDSERRCLWLAGSVGFWLPCMGAAGGSCPPPSNTKYTRSCSFETSHVQTKRVPYPTCMRVCVSACLRVCVSACLRVCVSACLRVCLSVRLFCICLLVLDQDCPWSGLRQAESLRVTTGWGRRRWGVKTPASFCSMGVTCCGKEACVCFFLHLAALAWGGGGREGGFLVFLSLEGSTGLSRCSLILTEWR
ncbi:hypothetical protein QBC33DRAFT_258080 [Phialemonium atrogriseum]|uniref:Uncharacterized protein n=1 Tax=Phialemonium atrogriseum TaxID=1093897 RepID=A0AAJ0FBK8_9PEZI|nr:uncharacterized protein QBC33DRAFT_258080 [Phialemonium atrogriseum]KAK1762596.1 hypothetical protein QBC33DRAFT_258080 [Phialemonium atrogriseum]